MHSYHTATVVTAGRILTLVLVQVLSGKLYHPLI